MEDSPNTNKIYFFNRTLNFQAAHPIIYTYKQKYTTYNIMRYRLLVYTP